jgi:methylenetetrahydrofolate dehydrogenase (NADP+)/methenyltetrahydrofolate cyclohydrolase
LTSHQELEQVHYRETETTARIIDGKEIAGLIRAETGEAVAKWRQGGHRAPFLSVVLVGDDPASASYVRGKTRACGQAGIESDTLTYPDSITEDELLAIIDRLNRDDAVDGILVQLPLPAQIKERRVIDWIDPGKDVDGFHPVNVGRLVLGHPGFVPATPAGIIELLRRSDIQIAGRSAVIVGRSNIVGKPLANLLIQKGCDATVTVCHSRTPDLPAVTRQADILIAAMGRAEFITADMVKEGAAVIDVGINRVDDPSTERGYRLTGDVAFDEVARKAGWITLVFGGVGPMTIAMVLRNTWLAASHALGE